MNGGRLFLLLLCSAGSGADAFTTAKGTPRPTVATSSFSYTTAKESDVVCIGKSPGKGMGAFAVTLIVQGAWIGEYTGEYLTRQQVEARYWDRRKPTRRDHKWRNSRKRRNQGLSGDYLFDMGDDLFIDGEDADVSSWCRFANHASPGVVNGGQGGGGGEACNTETYRVEKTPEGEKLYRPQLWFKALRDIDVGEEILYDYGVEYWDQEEC